MEPTYNDIKIEHLRTTRPRPINLKELVRFKKSLTLADYPRRGKEYNQVFLEEVHNWIKSHSLCKLLGLDTFPVRESILGTTHSLDEIHFINKGKVAVLENEYRYHGRLNVPVKFMQSWVELSKDDVFVVSMPNCNTTNIVKDYNHIFNYCLKHNIPVHIDAAWFGCTRNFELDCSHPAIKSVSVSLSKSLAMGNQRIGIRYTREKIVGPISIMNDFGYHNVSDQWMGIKMMKHFGPDYLWSNYEEQYNKVCQDFNLTPSDAIHVAWNNEGSMIGTRLPLRMLIDKKWDNR